MNWHHIRHPSKAALAYINKLLEMGQSKKTGKVVPRAPQTFHYHKYIRDTIAVQKEHNYVNDDEEHEEHPHLEDFLVPHHSGDIELAAPAQEPKPTLSRPCASILHNVDCPSRHSCEITESKRHISFHQIIVRDYDMVLGDHPNCSYGPPVSLGWHYLEYEPLDLNEYEYHHSRRRPLRQLVLNSYRRKKMLLTEKAHTLDELNRATKEKNRVQKNRSITRTLVPYWKVEDAFESAGRKLKRIVKKAKGRLKIVGV